MAQNCPAILITFIRNYDNPAFRSAIIADIACERVGGGGGSRLIEARPLAGLLGTALAVAARFLCVRS